MKFKGNTKRVGKPNFWKGYDHKVSKELKKLVLDQYLNTETLFVYCDMSASKLQREMSVACTYLMSGNVVIKIQYVYPPEECVDKEIYGELKALIFGLSHFEKYLLPQCNSVIFFSDVANIEGLLMNEITFKKNKSLRKLQIELIMLYEKVKMKNTNRIIEIRYLPLQYKVHNPFYKSSHNAAYKMLNRKRK